MLVDIADASATTRAGFCAPTRLQCKVHAPPRLRRVVPFNETKHAEGEISHITVAGTFDGYASLFGVVDLSRDEVVAGAFRDTLRTRGARGIKMLWQHDATEPIGSWLSVVEDARGLKVQGRLNLAVARAREVLALMRDGAVDGLSIGFRAQRATTDAKTGVRRLQKLDLWEISVVTFPMLPQARVSAVKRREIPRDESGRLAGAIRRAASLLK